MRKPMDKADLEDHRKGLKTSGRFDGLPGQYSGSIT
jgi:hypothetical protein